MKDFNILKLFIIGIFKILIFCDFIEKKWQKNGKNQENWQKFGSKKLRTWDLGQISKFPLSNL